MANEKKKEVLSPFELLPREIKERILGRVINDRDNFDKFKKFWRLKRVNKEFYSIFTSNYAKRHFLKYPCWIMMQDDKRNREKALVSISRPISRKDISYENMTTYDDIIISGVRFAYRSIRWDMISTYFRNKPLSVELVLIDPLYSTDHQISTVIELANQSSEKIQVLVSPSCRDDGLDFDVNDEEQLAEAYYQSFKKIMEGLANVHEAGKINLQLDKDFFDDQLLEDR